ncbi:hypothetical protein HO173_000471 [Letharia columbiana]|uniref:Uncharacterized protein n=1 Tax=Letharia columbiana TaxID=112416 RepID=A0A8H6G791_9LECA|nr:uncharacterized protein HO173_000471 [Letharia columbiana]KAF6241759.1 hypothetical protein HO173_000471 [Letharia columbiana]
MKAAAKTVGVVGATATMMRLKRMTSKVFAALQLVAMRLYSGEDDGNEYGNNEDRSHEAPSNKHCSNDSGGKNPHGAASNSGRNGAANAAVVVRDNSVARGRSGDEHGHMVPGNNDSNSDVDGRFDKRHAEEH